MAACCSDLHRYLQESFVQGFPDNMVYKEVEKNMKEKYSNLYITILR